MSVRALLASSLGAAGMTPSQAAGPLVTALCVLLTAHMNGLCFADLKPDNMCLSGERACVVDAGSVTAFGNPINSASQQYYQQEEPIASARFDRVCWASTAYHLVMGNPPPDASSIYTPRQALAIECLLPPLGTARPSTPREALALVIESALDSKLSLINLIGVVIHQFQPDQAAVYAQLRYVSGRVLGGALLPAEIWSSVFQY